MFLSKYGVARHIYIPMVKRAVVDFAVGADWTPSAGDVKISKDGGAAANVTNLPTAITMGNTAMWDFSLTSTEMQAAQVVVTVADSATKAVEDTQFDIETYGNASAQHAVDLSDSVRAGLTALPNAAAEAAGGLFTRGTGAGQINQDANGRVDVSLKAILGTTLTETAGQIAAAFKKFFDKATPTGTINSIPDAVAGAAGGIAIVGSNMGTTTSLTGDAYARLGAPVGASTAADIAAVKAVLPAALVSGRMDSSVGAMAASVLNRAAFAADTGMQSVRSNTAAGGAAATITLDASASAVDSFYVGQLVYLTGATGVGQIRVIVTYVGATKVATVSRNWVTNPDNTSTYALIPVDTNKLNSSLEVVASAISAGGIIAASFGVDAIDATALKADAVAEIWASATRTLTGSQGIKKNTAKAAFMFAMTDSTAHAPATGLTVTATRSLDGAAFASCANAVVEVASGWYKIDLAAADLNGDTVALKFTATGGDQLNISLVTSP